MQEDQANTQTQGKKLSELSIGELETLDEQLNQGEAPEDVEIPAEMLGEISDGNSEQQTEETVEEQVSEETTETDESTEEVQETQEDEVDEDLKDTPFKDKSEAVKAWKNLNRLVGKQGQKIGELTSKLQEQGQQSAQPQFRPQQNHASDSGQSIEYDPYDQSSVDAYISRKVRQMVSPHLTEVNNVKQTLEDQKWQREEERWRDRADIFSGDHPEYAIQDDLDNVLIVMEEAKKAGENPIDAHPEAAKVVAVQELINMVRNSNGIIRDLEHAHRVKLTDGDGLDKLLSENTRKATVKTVNHINKKGKSAPNLAKAGGAAEKKTLKDLSNEELYQLSKRMQQNEAQMIDDERIARF